MWKLMLAWLALSLALACGRNAPPIAASTATPIAVGKATVGPEASYPFEVQYRDFGRLAADDASVFGSLLTLTPDTPQNREQIWLNDLKIFWATWERVGAARPTDQDGASAFGDRYVQVFSSLNKPGVPPDFPFPVSDPWIAGFGQRSYTASVKFFEYAGFDARNVDGMLLSGPGPIFLGFAALSGEERDALEVVVGKYDTALIADAIGRCLDCVPPEVARHDGDSYMAWANDYQQSMQNRLKGPFFDYLGRGGRVAVFDGVIYRALSTHGIEQLLDSRAGRVPNLAQDRDYRMAAAGLNAAGAHAAVVSSSDFSLNGLKDVLARSCIAQDMRGYTAGPLLASPTPDCEVSGRAGSNGLAVAETSPLMRTFQVAAFANAWDPERAATDTAIVLVHPDDSSAKANVELLLRRLAETRVPGGELVYAGQIERVEIGTSGQVLIAKVIRKPGLSTAGRFLQLDTITTITPAIHE